MPRRKGGLFLPLDVHFMDDPKVVRAGRDAAWLYLAMALACKRYGLDGTLEGLQIDRLHVTGWRKLLPKLVEHGLVAQVDEDTWGLVAWFEHNDPAHVVQARRAADADRKRGGKGTPSAPTPNGNGAESGRRTEQSREERSSGPAGRSSSTPVDKPVDSDCEHGWDRFACATCARARKATA